MKRTYLTLIIAMLVIGFAAVATNLMISGKLNIGFNENDFEVYFSKATLDGEQSESLITSDGKSIKFTSKVLTDIGHVSTLVYEVTNNSKQYDAQVKVTCEPQTSDYITLSNTMDDTLIEAQSEETGTLTATLKTLTTEEKDENITCKLEVNAVSRTSVEEQKEEETYSIGAYLYDKDDNELSNKYLVVYSNTPHYVETDNEGYFYVEGLERGIHEIYYMQDTNPNGLTKEEVKEQAIDEARVTTDAKKIEFENGKVKTEKESIGKEKDITKVSVEVGEKVYSKVVEDNSVEFEIDKSSYTTILCNQKVELDENDKIEISEVAQDTECKLYTSIVDAINDHNTKDNIGTMMMLNDETLNNNYLRVVKELHLNLNGKNITSNMPSQSVFYLEANANFYNLKENGKIISNTSDGIGINASNVTATISLDIVAARSAVRSYSNAPNTNITLVDNKLECNNSTYKDGCLYLSSNSDIINGKNINIESIDKSISNSGTINLLNSNINSANDICIDNYFEIKLNGGKYSSNGVLINNQNTGTAIIESGNYFSKENYVISNLGSVEIKGSEVVLDDSGNYVSGTYLRTTGSDHSVIMQYYGKTNIYGGTIFHPHVDNGTWRQHALRLEGGVANILGGSFNTLGYSDGVNGVNSYDTIYLNQNAVVNINGGTIQNNVLVNYERNVSQPECIVNICGGKFSGWLNVLNVSGVTSHIYYKSSGIIWDNDKKTVNIHSASAPNVTVNDSITCGVN